MLSDLILSLVVLVCQDMQKICLCRISVAPVQNEDDPNRAGGFHFCHKMLTSDKQINQGSVAFDAQGSIRVLVWSQRVFTTQQAVIVTHPRCLHPWRYRDFILNNNNNLSCTISLASASYSKTTSQFQDDDPRIR